MQFLHSVPVSIELFGSGSGCVEMPLRGEFQGLIQEEGAQTPRGVPIVSFFLNSGKNHEIWSWQGGGAHPE